MNCLVIGKGGREHALAWKMAQSPLLGKLYVAPGNPGTSSIAENIAISETDFESIATFIREKAIDLLVVGPEAPLVAGIRDYLESLTDLSDLMIIGPGKSGAQLEGSKSFSKAFMMRHGIPTARYGSFTKAQVPEAMDFLKSVDPPYVLKADGLAAGKGVIITDDLTEAERTLSDMLLDAKFGDASSSVVIEQFLDGIEVSVFVLTDGSHYLLLPEAKDYKRIGEGDKGLNTGGMGAISPVPFADQSFMEKVRTRIIEPTVSGLRSEGIEYSGFIFFGLTNVDGEPWVIEYNARMGDPETEAVLPRIDGDLLAAMVACERGNLSSFSWTFTNETAATVIAVSGGYPEAYEKGKQIKGLDMKHEAVVFHAGTKHEGSKTSTDGGRVLAITGTGNTKKEALAQAYTAISKISFEGMTYRKDIGFDL